MNAPAPGWHPDPSGRHEHRYWDGSRWTDDVADGGVSATDAIDGSTAPGGTAAHHVGNDPTTISEPVYGDQTQIYPGQGASPAPGAYGTPPGMAPSGYGAAPGGPGDQGMPPGPGDAWPGAGMPPETPKKKPVGLIVGAVVLVVALVGGIGYFVLGGDDKKDDDKTEIADRSGSRGDRGRVTTTMPDESVTDNPWGVDDDSLDDMFGDAGGMGDLDDMFGDMEGMEDMFAGMEEMMNELYSDPFMREILVEAMVEDGQVTRAEAECAMDVFASMDITDLMGSQQGDAAFNAEIEAACGPGVAAALG